MAGSRPGSASAACTWHAACTRPGEAGRSPRLTVWRDGTMADASPPGDALSDKAQQVERLREFIDATSFAGDEQEVSGELSGVDQHPADVSDVVEQCARDYAIREILEGDAEQIRHAQ